MRLLWVVLFWLASSLAIGAETLLFGVNEGTSGTSGFGERQEKYMPLANYLSRAVARDVRLESASDLKNLTRSLKASRYDLVFIRPSHISAAGMRDQGYNLVAMVEGEATAHFIVNKASALKTRDDLTGKQIAMPDELAYPTRIGYAMIRDAKFAAPPNVRMFGTQEAVGYAVENGFFDAGVVISYSKVWKNWEKSGHRAIWQSGKLPYWSIICSPKMKPEQITRVREALLVLDKSEDGRAILEKIGVRRFVPGDQQAYLDMLNWIERS